MANSAPAIHPRTLRQSSANTSAGAGSEGAMDSITALAIAEAMNHASTEAKTLKTMPICYPTAATPGKLRNGYLVGWETEIRTSRLFRASSSGA